MRHIHDPDEGGLIPSPVSVSERPATSPSPTASPSPASTGNPQVKVMPDLRGDDTGGVSVGDTFFASFNQMEVGKSCCCCCSGGDTLNECSRFVLTRLSYYTVFLFWVMSAILVARSGCHPGSAGNNVLVGGSARRCCVMFGVVYNLRQTCTCMT